MTDQPVNAATLAGVANSDAAPGTRGTTATASVTASAPVVTVDDLTIVYAARRNSLRLQALTGLGFSLHSGTVTVVIGESGSGKSTLAAVLGELLPKAEATIGGGSAKVLGTPLRGATKKQLDQLRLRVGYLAQDAGSRLTPQLTVSENVAEPILRRDRRWDPRDLELKVAALLDRVKLPLSMMDRLPYELSSGMRQRVALARSLVLEPEVWVADEPSRGIDVTLTDLVPELIAHEAQSRPFASLVVSHELAFRDGFADRMMVLGDGTLVGYDTPERILADPVHPYLAALAAIRNLC